MDKFLFHWINPDLLPERLAAHCRLYWTCDASKVLVEFEDGTKVAAALTDVEYHPAAKRAIRSAKAVIRGPIYQRKNNRRGDLIHKRIFEGGLTLDEEIEHAELDRYVSETVDAACPRDPMLELEEHLKLQRGDYDIRPSPQTDHR